MRRTLAVLALGLMTGCAGSHSPLAAPTPSPTVNQSVLAECQQIGPLLGDVSDALSAGGDGTITPEQSYVKVEQVRGRIDALADTFTSHEIAVNAHEIASRIGVTLVSLRRGDDDPGVAIATVGTATDDFLAACHRVAGG